MVKVHFTPNLHRHLACPEQLVSGDTARQALDQVFTENPQLESYIFDDQGELRKHIAMFVDGERTKDLSTPLQENTEIFIIQALSGG